MALSYAHASLNIVTGAGSICYRFRRFRRFRWIGKTGVCLGNAGVWWSADNFPNSCLILALWVAARQSLRLSQGPPLYVLSNALKIKHVSLIPAAAVPDNAV